MSFFFLNFMIELVCVCQCVCVCVCVCARVRVRARPPMNSTKDHHGQHIHWFIPKTQPIARTQADCARMRAYVVYVCADAAWEPRAAPGTPPPSPRGLPCVCDRLPGPIAHRSINETHRCFHCCWFSVVENVGFRRLHFKKGEIMLLIIRRNNVIDYILTLIKLYFIFNLFNSWLGSVCTICSLYWQKNLLFCTYCLHWKKRRNIKCISLL